VETALVGVIVSLVAIIAAGVKTFLDAVRAGELVGGTTHRETIALLVAARDQNDQLGKALTVTAAELAEVKRNVVALRRAAGKPVASAD
jgi:antitoxin (DNA-binding transcriptional repressor) of toxin-antitoxin stability system